jgi:hypothetical protein
MSSFIVTAQGFFKERKTILEPDSPVPVRDEYIYTDTLREARIFGSRNKATQYMEKHGLVGFVYNPWAQAENLEPKYEVRKKHRYGFEEGPKIEEYIPVKAWQKGDSDVAFLNMKKEEKRELYTFEEAKQKALELNRQVIEQYMAKIAEIENITEEDARRLTW